MTVSTTNVPTVYSDIFRMLKQVGVTVSAGLPDDWVAPLLDLLDADDAITNMRVAREPEIIGICSGAFFAGTHAVGVMGATGFLTCISEIATLSLKYRIPLFLVVSLRGRLHDLQTFQEIQGRVLIPQMQILGLPHLILDSVDKISLIPQAHAYGRLQKRPYVVCLSKALITGAVSEL